MSRVKRLRGQTVPKPQELPEQHITYEGKDVVVPGSVPIPTYYTRRRRGCSHEEAINPNRLRQKPASEKNELTLDGSRPPRKGRHPLRGWQAPEGRESPDQIAAVKKHGIK